MERIRRWTAAVCVALGTLSVAAGETHAEELWTIRAGHLHLHLNVHLLRDLGVELEVAGTRPAPSDPLILEEPYWSFPIQTGSDLRFLTEHGAVLPQGTTAGLAKLGGSIVLRDRATGRVTRFDDLVVANGPPDRSHAPGALGSNSLQMRSGGSGLVLFDLEGGMFDLRRRPGLEVHYLNARITRSWARAFGRPELAGLVVGLGEVRAAVERVASAPATRPPYQAVFSGGLLDLSLGALDNIQQVAHTGTHPTGSAAVSMATSSCNVGEVDVPWLAPMSQEHPVIHMALYRLRDGRFEQIGVSWVKHGFLALSNSQCTPCQNPSDGSFLGVGCSDTYGVMNNASRSDLGPRSEVNVYTGTWECLGSHFAGGEPDCVRRHGTSGHGPLDHRMVVADADLENPGATYYYEAAYIVAGDGNLANNWGHRRCEMTWNGYFWNFSTPAGNPLVAGPALEEWGAASALVEVAPGDGQVQLAVRATDVGGGTWHYEYALLNRNSHRQLRSFSLPVTGVPNLANIGFHDSDDVATNDWQLSVDADTIRWQTETFDQNPGAHALEFGNLFNFRFDADSPPTSVLAAMAPFRPGVESAPVALTTGPTGLTAAAVDARGSPDRVLEIRPNPSTRTVTISYRAAATVGEIGIYDAAGRLIRRLGGLQPGTGVHSVLWNGDDQNGVRVRAGVYYARLGLGAATAAKSVVIVD